MVSNNNLDAADSDTQDITLFSEKCSLNKTSEAPISEGKSSDRQGSLESSLGRGSASSTATDESGGSSVFSPLNKPHKANDARWDAIHASCARKNPLGLNHFRLLKKIGCGDVGTVYLSELDGSKLHFAMKVMDKDSLVSRKKLLRAETEREILELLDHPFLPTLYAHFETDKYFCLVMEYCPGGDLHVLRQQQPGKHFSESAARFYVAEVLMGLEYLHMLGIIYRDLKPENVLMREDGHIMLSDFDLSLRCLVSPTLVRSSRNPGRAISTYCIEPSCIQPSCFVPRLLRSKSKKKEKKLKNEPGNQVMPLPELIAEPTDARSMSFVGTHEYLAPEIIKGEGHGSAVDWWTLGIFIYELLLGKTPFKGPGNRATLFNVVGQSLKFPEMPSISFEARDLIRCLLHKDPQLRLGSKRGATEIKQHPFFQGVNWALIRCMVPPQFPILKPMELEQSSKIAPGPSAGQTSDVNPGSDLNGKFLDFELF